MPQMSHILDPVNITDSTHLHDIKKRKTYIVIIPTSPILPITYFQLPALVHTTATLNQNCDMKKYKPTMYAC